jgi:hypothetical protein
LQDHERVKRGDTAVTIDVCRGIPAAACRELECASIGKLKRDPLRRRGEDAVVVEVAFWRCFVSRLHEWISVRAAAGDWVWVFADAISIRVGAGVV